MSAAGTMDGTAGRAPADAAAGRRGTLVTACGLAALLTGILVVWLALESELRGIWQLPWTFVLKAWRAYLPEIAWAAPPLAAGALCLGRRRVSRLAPAAVFGCCTPLLGAAVQIPINQQGTVVTLAVLLAITAGMAAIAAAILIAGLVRPSRRRLALWLAVAAVFTALSIPTPVVFTGESIQTIFSGTSHAEVVTGAFGLLFVAVPLIAAGLVSARTSAAIIAGWLPIAAAQILVWYRDAGLGFQLHADFWLYVECLAWLAVGLLALSQLRAEST